MTFYKKTLFEIIVPIVIRPLVQTTIMADLEAIHDRFRSFIYLRDVHAMEWFEDFDKLRSGRVTVERFHRVLATIRFHLSDAEFDALSRAYITDEGFVNYRDFLSNCEDIFSNRALERAPGDSVRDARQVVTRALGVTSGSDDAKYKALFSRLCYQIQTRGVHVREAYEDFDKHNNGTVTGTQFFRGMPFRDLSADEMQLLVKRYADPILHDVNYRRMITDLNNFQQMQSQMRSKETFATGTGQLLPHQLASVKVKNFAKDPDDLMRGFAKHVREGRIRIKEFFKQHDPLNKGIVLREKFEGTLTLFGFLFLESDLDNLAERYKVVLDSTDYARYSEFVRDIEELAGIVEGNLKTRSVGVVRPPELERVLQRVRDTIIRFRINALPTLQDFDRLGRGYITKVQFHRALATLGITITNAELELLAGGYEDDSGIDFYKFVEDVDATHQQSRRAFKPVGADRTSIENVYGHTPTGDVFVTSDKADEMIHQSKKGLLTKVCERTDITSLMHELRRWTYVNSVDFQEFLSDFDKHKIGEITGGQFRTGIGLSTYKMTDKEFEQIEQEYGSTKRPGYIMWRKFSRDVIQAIAPLDLAKTPKEGVPLPKDTFNPRAKVVEARESVPANVKQILDLVARFVKVRRISLMEQFKDKDKFGHKRVTATGFAQVLQLIGVHLSKNEIDILCGHYNDAAINFVDYTLFVNDIDAMVGLLFGDRASTSIVAKPIPDYGNVDSPYVISRHASGDNCQWIALKEKIQSYIYKRRVRIEDFFLAFDKLRSGKVPDQKFRSVIGQIGVPLSAEEIDYLINTFRVEGTNDMVCYRTFVHQLNKIFGKKELQKKPVDKGKPKVGALPDPSKTISMLENQDQRRIEEILDRMRGHVITRRMNIREQFQDYDKVPRKNFITRQQFKQCIARLGLSTDPREFELLCKRYSCTELEDMNYRAFCDEIDRE